MKDILRQIAVLLSTIAVIAINGVANYLPLNGQTTGEISDRFDVFFVPAGYVFAIWGLIYVALIAYSIFQVLPSQRQNPRLQRTGWLYVLACAANIAWLFLWHYEYFAWTMVAMGALLVLLIAIYLILGTGRSIVSTAETWLARVPFSLYLGWITVATIANATALLAYLGWDGWGLAPEWWAVIMIAAATIIASAVSLSRVDVAYAGVIVWAFVGIAVKHAGSGPAAIAAIVGAIIVLLALLFGALPDRGQKEAEEAVVEEGPRDRW